MNLLQYCNIYTLCVSILNQYNPNIIPWVKIVAYFFTYIILISAVCTSALTIAYQSNIHFTIVILPSSAPLFSTLVMCLLWGTNFVSPPGALHVSERRITLSNIEIWECY